MKTLAVRVIRIYDFLKRWQTVRVYRRSRIARTRPNKPQRHGDTESNASRRRFAAAALAMNDENPKQQKRHGFAFSSFITSARSAGAAGRSDALGSAACAPVSVHSVPLWLEFSVCSLLIEFVAPTSLFRETHRASALPIVGNGPPGTFVVFPDGLRVSLPTDQIVFADDSDGHARVGFGGMEFVGLEDGSLTFVRVRELWPEDQLSPARSHTMLLAQHWITAVVVSGHRVWPA